MRQGGIAKPRAIGAARHLLEQDQNGFSTFFGFGLAGGEIAEPVDLAKFFGREIVGYGGYWLIC